MSTTIYDVIQVGYGPVSESLAIMLGRQGRSVAIIERWTERYPLPRAVCVDHELYRTLSANGMRSMLPDVTEPGPLYQWFNADWKELLVIDWSAPSISGGPEVNFVHQPTLEAALDEEVRKQASVELNLGWEVVGLTQSDGLAHVDMRHCESGEERRLSARFVIGCDGANSIVRDTIGGDREDRGFEADWLVIDVLLKEGVTIESLGIPAAGQYCNPTRPTTIVPAGVRRGRTFRRWEFMRLPGETIEELEREETVWALLKPWAGPDEVELIRHKIYNFRSLIANKWRDERLMIAGDAAHVMPPFMGQGMCAGLRDAWNLSWKLGLILDGKADSRLLETYQTERHPHVRQITDISIYLGKVICTPDPAVAAERDEAFLSGTAEPPPPFPQLTDGLLRREKDGALSAGAGLLSPHVELKTGDQQFPMDDLIAGKFVVLSRGFSADSKLDSTAKSALASLDVCFLGLNAGGAQDTQDLDGRLNAFLDEHEWSSVIIRPDYYVYGGAAQPDDLQDLVSDLVSDLANTGVSLDI